MNKILRKIRKIFYLNQIRLGPRFGRLPNEIVVEMLWENRLSFHNLLSISGGKKVEYLWENLVSSFTFQGSSETLPLNFLYHL